MKLCEYCDTLNHFDEQICIRCGKTLHEKNSRTARFFIKLLSVTSRWDFYLPLIRQPAAEKRKLLPFVYRIVWFAGLGLTAALMFINTPKLLSFSVTAQTLQSRTYVSARADEKSQSVSERTNMIKEAVSFRADASKNNLSHLSEKSEIFPLMGGYMTGAFAKIGNFFSNIGGYFTEMRIEKIPAAADNIKNIFN